MRRVVVTGLGAVTPLGGRLDVSWDRLIKGESGISPIHQFDTSDFPCKIAGSVPGSDVPHGLNLDDFIPKKDQRKMDRFVQFAMAASAMAIADAGWTADSDDIKERAGVCIGSGIGGLPYIEQCTLTLDKDGLRRLTPFFIPASLINLAAGQVSIAHDLRGPNHAVVTACSSGAHAIGDAARFIKYGDADMMVAGGTEASICAIGIGGFSALKSLSTSYNDRPAEASRPWDQGHDGFVMGEGAGIMVLEEYEHAKKRGAKIYAEFLGYGLSGDAYHMTAPSGDGAYRAMKAALRDANIPVEAIAYINAHGTSTPVGDMIEYRAVKRFLGDHSRHVLMSSTKSSIGHLLGGAGGIEAVFSVLSLYHHIAPPTLNLHDPYPECDMDLVPHHAKDYSPAAQAVLSNSFGFGGTNTSLIFGRAPA